MDLVLLSKPGRTSSLNSGSRVNHRATAHLWPLVTAFTPWGFSPPDEKPTILPHWGFTDACRGPRLLKWPHFAADDALMDSENDRVHSRWCAANRLTVTVLASISVNMNSPPSKSPLRYKSALGRRMRRSERTRSESWKRRQPTSPGRTCSLCRCRLEAPSSTRWPRGPADSCRREWGDSDRSCGPAGLLMDEQCTNINKRRRKATGGS